MLSLLFSSCYTRYVYINTDEPVDEVYIYDVNYVYTNLWYDDFYWQYDVRNYYCGFGFYYTPNYYHHNYSYYYNYRPYYKYHRRHKDRTRLSSRHTTRRLAGHLRGQNDPIGRGKARYNKNRSKLEHRQKDRQGVQVKPQNKRKLKTWTKKRDQVVTKRKWNNNRSKNKTKIHRSPTRNSSPKTKIRRSPSRNNSPKKSNRSSNRSSTKRSTKKGRR